MRFFFVVSCLLIAGCKDATKDFEKLADQACECSQEDTACGSKVLTEVTRFAETHKTSDGDMRRINEAGKRLYECLNNTGVKPTELTAALEKLVD